MDVLGDLVARPHRSADPALLAPAAGRTYDYRRFCTTTWKVGNFLRHLGVGRGRDVAVVGEDLPEAVLTFYGAALLGASVSFDPPSDHVDARALVAPTDRIEAYDVEPGTQRVAYGETPDDPRVASFERDVWSENPTEPPDEVAPEDDLLRVTNATADATANGTATATVTTAYTHGEVLDTARRVVDEMDIDASTTVAVRAPLSTPGTVVAGLVAPILADGAVMLADDEAVGAIAVTAGEAPEPTVIDPTCVFS